MWPCFLMNICVWVLDVVNFLPGPKFMNSHQLLMLIVWYNIEMTANDANQ